MMKKLVCIVAMLGFFASNAAAQDLEFKGLHLGQMTTPSQVEQQLKTDEAQKLCGRTDGPCADLVNISCGAGVGGAQVCNGKTTIAGSSASLNAVIGAGGRLQRISLTFSNDAYDEVHDALLQKYGKPSSMKKYLLQNGFGAEFVQIDTVWQRAGGLRLRLSRYGASTDDSAVYFSTKADDDMLKRSGDSSDL